MTLNFNIELEDRKLFKIYDISTNRATVPEQIWSYTLEVIGSRMPGGRLPYSLDIIAYLKSQMIQDEIYTISSGDLGFAENIDIPDGVYTFICTINNIITRTNKVLVYQNVKYEVNELLKEADYSVEVTSNTMKYLDDKSNSVYNIETVRYAKVLMDKLEEYATMDDEIEVEDTLDKLERLLGILKLNL